MPQPIIEQHEMNYEELTRRYRVKAPRVVEGCEKYKEADFVVFQREGVPMLVFVKHVTTDNDARLVMLYNVMATVLDTDIGLLRRYKSSYEQKAKVVAFDLPRTVLVDGSRPAILRFTKSESDSNPAHIVQPLTLSQDTLQQNGGMDWLNVMLPGLAEGQELHLVCYTPSVEHTYARYLTEEHGFRNHRGIYIA
ncbi:hypothetical protein BZ973_00430 [Salmonella enterica subsp. enterica serovar Enteritidis]|uniref:Uncharacterized protein n=2 Tax=Salmonella enterica TaxID=28901 RepID=A0A5W4PR94_SALEN|nr:hypothetical protein [Salmonella enterica subsp. enterica serovar Enteritidis]EBW9188194.1 hypothetical protein [Salmonella enterica subsp. enterica serovar Enteritidis]EDI7382666.1 hypothetical protein [Salmonella enterica subsp. enterica serovar Mbandaka]